MMLQLPNFTGALTVRCASHRNTSSLRPQHLLPQRCSPVVSSSRRQSLRHGSTSQLFVCRAKKSGKVAETSANEDDSDWDAALSSDKFQDADADESEDLIDASGFDDDDNPASYDAGDEEDEGGETEVVADADEDEDEGEGDVSTEQDDLKMQDFEKFMNEQDSGMDIDLQALPPGDDTDTDDDVWDDEEEVTNGRSPTKAAMTVVEDADLALSRQGYASYEMDDLELLVSQTEEDGTELLDLSKMFVLDYKTGSYEKPAVPSSSTPGREIPVGARMYQAFPWVERRNPDTVKGKDGLNRVLKVIFVAVETHKPYKLKLDEVYMFDGKSRTLNVPEVRRIGDNIVDPVLRIRNNIITIEDSGMAPTPVQVSMGWVEEDAAERHARDEERRLKELEERVEEMELRAELDNVEDAPDVGSASDLA